MDESLSDRERAVKFVENMRLEQKIAQLHDGIETFVVPSAEFTVHTGASSDDDREMATFNVCRSHLPTCTG